MVKKIEALKSFKVLSEYLKNTGQVHDIKVYQKDFSAFLLHARHIWAYNFITQFCKNKKVLDIGCFLGYGQKIVSPYAKQVIAIDLNENVIKMLQQKCFLPNVKFMKANACNMPFKKETFGTIIAFQLIEHVHPKKILKCLREINRVLKNNGIFVLATPNRKTRLRIFQKPFNPEHYQEFTCLGLKKILKPIFSNVQITGIRGKKYIEQIEKDRVYHSFYKLYIKNMILSPIKELVPKKVKNYLKKNREQSNKQLINNQFDKLFNNFSMSHFYLEKNKKLIDKSLDLFVMCKK